MKQSADQYETRWIVSKTLKQENFVNCCNSMLAENRFYKSEFAFKLIISK